MEVTNICLDDFEGICRICLKSVDLKPLKELAVYSVFLDIKHLIQEDELEDELPNNICQCCVKDLENISTFLFRAKESEDILRFFIKDKLNTQVPTVNNKSATVLNSKGIPEKEYKCLLPRTNETSEETGEVVNQNTQEHEADVVEDATNNGKYEDKQKSQSKRRHKRNKIFTCDYCGKNFERIFHLQEHINVHLGLKPFKCSICGRGFAKRQTLTTHYSVHTGRKPFKCKLCGQSFHRLIGLSKHSLNVHNGSGSIENSVGVKGRDHSPLSSKKPVRIFRCKSCNQQFSHINSWIRHNATHAINGKLRCSLCNWTGNSRKVLSVHVKDTHGQIERQRTFLCSTCGKGFTAKGSLNVHMRVHTEEKSFECNACQDRFTSKHALKRHLISAHILTKEDEAKDLNCSTCGHKFASRRWLTRHEKAHKSETDKESHKAEIKKEEKEPNSTDIKKEEKEPSLTEAKKTEEEPNPTEIKKTEKEPNPKTFLCTTCGKQFTFKCNLDRHISVIHTGQKAFKCDICGDTFTAKLSLDHHLNIHNDVKPYQCEHCPKAFRQPSSLRKHIVVHTGERRHKCEVCWAAFKTNSHLRAHVRRHF